MRKRRRGRMKRPNEGAAVEIFDFGYRKRIGAHDIPKTKDLRLRYFVGKKAIFARLPPGGGSRRSRVGESA